MSTSELSGLSLDDLATLGRLAAVYCIAVDAADDDLLTSIFVEDSSFRARDHVVSGRDNVIAFLKASQRGTHVASPPVAQAIDGGATMLSRFVFVPSSGAELLAGGYEDTCVRVDEGWRFVSRVVHLQSAPEAT